MKLHKNRLFAIFLKLVNEQIIDCVSQLILRKPILLVSNGFPPNAHFLFCLCNGAASIFWAFGFIHIISADDFDTNFNDVDGYDVSAIYTIFVVAALPFEFLTKNPRIQNNRNSVKHMKWTTRENKYKMYILQHFFFVHSFVSHVAS